MKVGKEMRIMRRDGAARTARWGKRLPGFTLIEVMVATMVLLVALAGLVPLFIAGLSQSSGVRYKSTAANIASEKIEQIRQLDYREIIDVPFLEDRFGITEVVRGVTFNIEYGLVESEYDSGVLKEVSVEVDWVAPPDVSPTRLTTMFHRQYVGPRISQMEVDPPPEPDLIGGTPFGVLAEDWSYTMYCHVAEADWGLVIDNLNQTGMTLRDTHLRLSMVDDNGVAVRLGDPAEDYEIRGLDYTTTDGVVSDVFIPFPIDPADMPDGYWEFRGVIYNQFDEPGNVWRLRLKVENSAPAAPVSFVAVPQYGDESIMLYWAGGDERDRDHYVIQRRDKPGADWKAWVDLATNVDPNATSYLDQGSIASATDPWGTSTAVHYYQYRIWAVDTEGNSGWDIDEVAYSLQVSIPPAIPVTTTTIDPALTTTTVAGGTTTTLPAVYTITVVNNVNQFYDILIEPGDPDLDDIIGIVEKRGTLVLGGFSAGSYNITATPANNKPVYASFTLGPGYDPGIPVLTIN